MTRAARASAGIRRIAAILLAASLALAQDGESGSPEDKAPSKPAAQETEPAAPGDGSETVVIRKGIYSIALPKSWVLTDREEEKAVLAWDLRLPRSEGKVVLVVFANDRNDPRSMPFFQAQWHRERFPGVKLETRTEPWPQLVAAYRPETEVRSAWVDWYLYRSIHNKPFTFRFSCYAEDFARSQKDVVQAVQSFTADVEPWPWIPGGYKTSSQGTWLIATAPGVTASTTPIAKVLKQQEQRFRRDHGALPKGEVILVLVHNSATEAARIEPEAAGGNARYYADVWRRRLFALPLDKEDPEDEPMLASCAQAVLFLVRYGDTTPYWVFEGERTLARAEAATGKPLPALDAGFYSWSKDMKLHKLDELPAMRETNWGAFAVEAFFYVASLHEGKYRKAYAKFLDDFAQTSDGDGAFSRQLLPSGLDELRAAAIEFTYKKIKPLEKKGK